MANIKITDLDAYANPDSTDVLPIVDVGADETKKVSIADLMENAGAGAEATPGIAFDGDPDTGIYRPAANQLAFSTGGTQRILIDDSGVVTVAGDLTVNGTTTTVNSTTVTVDDKNIELGSVGTPTDTTADGGGITLKGATDKTLNWVNSSDSWTSSENVDLASGKTYKIAGTDVLSATALGSAVQISSDNIPSGTIVNDDVNASAAIAGTKISADFGAQDLTVDTNVLHVDATNDRVGVGTTSPQSLFECNDSANDIQARFGTLSATRNPLIRLQGRNAANTTNCFADIQLDAENQVLLLRDPGTSGAGIGTNPVAIDNAGNVGIGTTSPTALLNLRDAAPALRLTADENDITELQFGDTGDTVRGNIVFRNGTGGNALCFHTNNNNEQARIDSDGRLLVGANSVTADATLVLQGASNTADGDSILFICRGTEPTTSVAGAEIGKIKFGDNSQNEAAEIRVERDGGTWTSGSSHPARINFYTTADGESTPTERMRINSDGTTRFTTGAVFLEAVSNTDNTQISLGRPNSTSAGYIRYHNSDDALAFRTGGSGEDVRIDSEGRLLVGTASEIVSGTADSSVHLVNGGGGKIYMMRDDSGSTVAGNDLGMLRFYSNDGGAQESARIEAEADLDHGTDDKPGRLVFFTTADGESTPTERLRITSDGTLQLRNSPGIDFSQIQGAPDSGSSTSEVLDSYEQGTFTPAYLPTSGSFTTINYTEQLGAYTKIGNRVFYNIRIRTSSLTPGTASGVLSIGGFPFTNVNSSSYGRNAASFSVVTGWGTAPSGGDLEINSNRLTLRRRNTTATDNTVSVSVSDMNTGTNQNQLWISGFYITET